MISSIESWNVKYNLNNNIMSTQQVPNKYEINGISCKYVNNISEIWMHWMSIIYHSVSPMFDTKAAMITMK